MGVGRVLGGVVGLLAPGVISVGWLLLEMRHCRTSGAHPAAAGSARRRTAVAS